MTAPTSKWQALRERWLTRKQVRITKARIYQLNCQSERLWEKYHNLDKDISSMSTIIGTGENQQVALQVQAALKLQKTAVEAQIDAMHKEVSGYRLFLIQIRNGLWNGLTGYKGSGTT